MVKYVPLLTDLCVGRVSVLIYDLYDRMGIITSCEPSGKRHSDVLKGPTY